MNEKLYKRCNEIGFKPSNICEVGVYKPETSNVLLFIKDGIQSTLIEPDPKCIAEIERYFKEFEKVRIIPCAIWDSASEIKLYRCSASTFVGEVKNSPAVMNDGYIPKEEDSFPVRAIKFSEIDDGRFDLISVDTEGCEWYVLKNMISKPKVISLEMKCKKYINPFYQNIESWMLDNNYRLWYSDGSDRVYIDNSIQIPLLLKFKYIYRNLFRLDK